MDNNLVMQRFDAEDKSTWPDCEGLFLGIRKGCGIAEFFEYDGERWLLTDGAIWCTPEAYLPHPNRDNITIVDITERARA